MKSLRRLPTVQNVVAGQKASIQLPVGLTFDSIILDLSASTTLNLAHLTNIRLVINGVVQQEFASAAELKAINAFYARSGATESDKGQVTLHFYRPEYANELMRSACALGTVDVATATIEMDISASASNPVITAYAVYSSPRPFGAITKHRRVIKTLNSGDQEVDNIPRTGGVIPAIHFVTANTTSLRLEADNSIIYEAASVTMANRFMQDGNIGLRRVPQTGYIHVDFCKDGDIQQSLKTENLSDFRAKLTLSSGETVNALVEYIDGFGGS